MMTVAKLFKNLQQHTQNLNKHKIQLFEIIPLKNNTRNLQNNSII